MAVSDIGEVVGETVGVSPTERVSVTKEKEIKINIKLKIYILPDYSNAILLFHVSALKVIIYISKC